MAASYQFVVSETTLNWLHEEFSSSVQALYDDPFGVCMSKKEIKEYVQDLRLIAEELGLDFEQIVRDEATDFEQARIQKILAEQVV